MYGSSAELKCSVPRNAFIKLYGTFLEKDKKKLEVEMKEQIVYFADNQELDRYAKEHIAIRYRRNNRGLEVTVKLRGVHEKLYKQLEEQFGNLENHILKLDIDQISKKIKTYSCVLKHTYNSMHQSFAFFYRPEELLTDAQKEFVFFCTDKKIKKLNYLIPLQSKTFIFPTSWKEFEVISLEERRMPKLFGNKFYEITLKTSHYTKNTVDHFMQWCKENDIYLQDQGIYKTQWLYDAYFNI